MWYNLLSLLYVNAASRRTMKQLLSFLLLCGFSVTFSMQNSKEDECILKKVTGEYTHRVCEGPGYQFLELIIGNVSPQKVLVDNKGWYGEIKKNSTTCLMHIQLPNQKDPYGELRVKMSFNLEDKKPLFSSHVGFRIDCMKKAKENDSCNAPFFIKGSEELENFKNSTLGKLRDVFLKKLPVIKEEEIEKIKDYLFKETLDNSIKKLFPNASIQAQKVQSIYKISQIYHKNSYKFKHY